MCGTCITKFSAALKYVFMDVERKKNETTQSNMGRDQQMHMQRIFVGYTIG